jgi:tetratricopeptide (TPR) repeat protein
MGDVQVAEGDLKAALKSYSDSRAIAERLAQSDPGNAQWQYDLGISNERIGDVQVAQGDLAAALKSYEAKRGIISRLAQSDPGDAGWQRDLSVSYERIGDVQKAQGDLQAALKSYRPPPVHPVFLTPCLAVTSIGTRWAGSPMPPS